MLPAAKLDAQHVAGELVVQGSGSPLARAFIILRDTAGAERARTLTDARGGFLLEAPGPGTYRLQTAIIGWKSWTSPPLALTPGDTVRYRIQLRLQAVRLDPVVVEGDRECRVGADSGQMIAQVWEEARKALAAVSWTQRADSIWYQALRYDRRLDPVNLKPLGGRMTRLTGSSLGSPFGSAPAEDLSAYGYIRRHDGGGWQYFGPDADVLLSDAFANDHCFFLRGDRSDEDLLGLAFAPVRRRELPDIEGVLWLNRESAELRFLEFRYRNLPWPVKSRHVGGWVEFERLSTGLWIVSHWRLLMPELAFATFTKSWTQFGRVTIEALRETGGYIIQLRDQGAPLVERPVAAGPKLGNQQVRPADAARRPPHGPLPIVRGIVSDLLTGGPVENSLVLLLTDEGVYGAATSSPQGWFQLEAPKTGQYSLRVGRFGYNEVAPQPLALAPGQIVDLRVNLRPAADSADTRPSGVEPHGLGAESAAFEVPGRYAFGEAEIAESGAASVHELVALVPGAASATGLEGSALVFGPDRCTPSVFLDGYPIASQRLLGELSLEWIGEVEVFLTAADTPEEYRDAATGTRGCGTVLLRTRR